MEQIWDWVAPLDLGLLGALALLWGYQLYFWIRYIARPWCKNKFTSSPADVPTPGVSVIVCARNEEDNLRHFLHAILTQDYPHYEVIVVDDESEDNTRQVVEEFAQNCPFLYVTFVPTDAHVRSGKKLAITLGAKAANYNYLLFTDADCRPESPNWIREMMKGFVSPQTEVVLGVGNYFEQKGWLNAVIQYETLTTALQYCGMALTGHPYMGVGRNLAYRRDTFFNHNGFSGLLSYMSGDDDLFVNKVATGSNTQVVCTPDSTTWSIPKNTWEEWIHQKRRHLLASEGYKNTNRLRIGLEPLSRGLMYGLIIALFVVGSPIAAGVAYVLWLIRLIIQLVLLNGSSKRLGNGFIGMEVVVYEMVLPIITLWLLVEMPMYKKRMRW